MKLVPSDISEEALEWRSFKTTNLKLLSALMFSAVVQKYVFGAYLVGLDTSRKGTCKANALQLVCDSFASKAFREQSYVEDIGPRVNLCIGNTWDGQSRLPQLPKISSKPLNATS